MRGRLALSTFSPRSLSLIILSSYLSSCQMFPLQVKQTSNISYSESFALDLIASLGFDRRKKCNSLPSLGTKKGTYRYCKLNRSRQTKRARRPEAMIALACNVPNIVIVLVQPFWPTPRRPLTSQPKGLASQEWSLGQAAKFASPSLQRPLVKGRLQH